MRIGLLGLIFHAGNKGCLALSYSFLEMLNEIAKKHNDVFEVKIFSTFPSRKLIKSHFNYRKCMQEFLPSTQYSNLQTGFIFYRDLGKSFFMTPNGRKCDMVFDFTAGDSFTDLYGRERFFTRSRLKKYVIDSGIPLVLGSQTIGPFKDKDVEKFAAEIINECKEVYVRDEMSLEYTKKISGRTAVLTTDVAFALPYEKQEKSPSKVRIGFNPSGLLWNEGEKYGLTVDYKKYCRQVFTELLKKENYELHLIAHAYSKALLDQADNDYTAMLQIKDEFPDIIVAPYYETPMEIKSYLSGMDVFVGARMHATVAAFSARVADIPFSYSRKFEGLFNSLGYEYVIHGCSDTTDDAVRKTLAWIEDRKQLEECVKQCGEKAEEKTSCLISQLDSLIYSK